GLSVSQMTLIFMTLIIIAFTFINYLGASETGSIGNVVTLAKIFILALFVLFGIIVMLRSGGWQGRFTSKFLNNGSSVDPITINSHSQFSAFSNIVSKTLVPSTILRVICG
ncbi:unnamed protein product, partial [marine sediment metagenome]